MPRRESGEPETPQYQQLKSCTTSTSEGFTKEQLYPTASYQAKNLQGIGLYINNLSEWDFSGQNLTNAGLGSLLTDADLTDANLANVNLAFANLTDANLSGANLKNANVSSSSFEFAVLSQETIYNQWTDFPDGFDPVAAGLTFMESPVGDLVANDLLDVADIDLLAAEIARQDYNGFGSSRWLPDAMFDVNHDSDVNQQDLLFWVHDLKHTWLGDANLDGRFNSNDIIDVLSANTYDKPIDYFEGGFVDQVSWAEGDFNADGGFNSDDLMDALADGGYEMGPRPMSVPEPMSLLTLLAVTRCDDRVFRGDRMGAQQTAAVCTALYRFAIHPV